MSAKKKVDPEPAEIRECSEDALEGIQGGTIVDEPDPLGRKGGPLAIIEGPDPI